MATVHVESGICGFSSTIRVSKGKRSTVGLVIESTCEMVDALGSELHELGMLELMKNPIHQNPVYMKAGQCKLHASCPVPFGVIKAAEAELGLALEKDVKMTFMTEK